MYDEIRRPADHEVEKAVIATLKQLKDSPSLRGETEGG